MRLTKSNGGSLALALAIGLLAAGCTGDETGDGQTGGTRGSGASGPTLTGPTPVVSGPATSGTYEYVNEGLRVILTIDGTAGTMNVDNQTGRELPKPGFYILDARDGHRIAGEVAAPAPVPAGETATFDISFSGVEVRNIGLVLLLFGADNYGAFVRTA